MLRDKMPDAGQTFFNQVEGNIPGVAALGGGKGGRDARGLAHAHAGGLDAEGGIGAVVAGNGAAGDQHMADALGKHGPQRNGSHAFRLMENEAGAAGAGVVLIHHPVRPGQRILRDKAVEIILFRDCFLSHDAVGFAYAHFAGAGDQLHILQPFLPVDEGQDSSARARDVKNFLITEVCRNVKVYPVPV